jgi:tRNA U34 5-carboxymethylaminomethyl modifying GTPase MnmE/TrmE
VATKSDSLTENMVTSRLAELNELFDAEFIPTSAKTGSGVEMLRDAIDKKTLDTGYGILDARQVSSIEYRESSIALTARHRQAVTEAIENISESVTLLDGINKIKRQKSCLIEEPPWEVVAMMLRVAYQDISNIEQETIDEQVLERIFSRFCIGK